MPSPSSISRAAVSFLVGESISNVVVAKVELHLWEGLPLSKVGPITRTRSISFPSLKVPWQSVHSTLLMTTGRFGGVPPSAGCGGGGTGFLRAGGPLAVVVAIVAPRAVAAVVVAQAQVRRQPVAVVLVPVGWRLLEGASRLRV